MLTSVVSQDVDNYKNLLVSKKWILVAAIDFGEGRAIEEYNDTLRYLFFDENGSFYGNALIINEGDTLSWRLDQKKIHIGSANRWYWIGKLNEEQLRLCCPDGGISTPCFKFKTLTYE